MKKIINENRWWLLGAAWLYTLTFVFNHYWGKSSSYESIANSFSQRIDNRLADFDQMCQDKTAIQGLLGFQPSAAKKYLDQEDAFYFLYTDSPNGMHLQYWSNAMVIPPVDNIPYKDTIKLVQYKNGTYVFVSHKLPNSLTTAVQLILVEQKYFIENNNLKKTFYGYPSLEKYAEITQQPTDYKIKARGSQILFYLYPLQNKYIVVFNWPSFLVEIAVTILLFVFFYRVGWGLIRNKKWLQVFTWISAAAVLLKLCVTYINFPVNVTNIEIFDLDTGNGKFLSSLGDLLFNLLLLTWVVYFTLRTRYKWIPQLENLAVRKKRRIAIATLLGLLVISFLLSQLTIKLILLPSVSFDVANFFSLGWNTISAIACLYFICVLHYRILHLSNEVFTKLWPQQWYIKYLVLAAGGLLILSLTIHVLPAKVLIIVLLWLLVSVMLEEKLPKLFFHNMERSVRFVFWLIWYAIFSTLLVQSQHSIKELNSEIKIAKSLANTYDTGRDSMVRHILVSTGLTTFVNKSFDPENNASNSIIRDTISGLFTQLLTGFTTKVFLFDSVGNNLYAHDSTTFTSLSTIVNQQSSPTSFEGIYSFKSSFDKIAYIIRQPLKADSVITGYLFITSVMNSNNSSTRLVPELFKPLRDTTGHSELFNYAIYNKGILQNHTRNFAFPTAINPSEYNFRSEYEMKQIDGKNTFWYKRKDKLVVIVKSTQFFNDFVTLFAYIFGCFIILYLTEKLLGRLIVSSYQLNPKWNFKAVSIRGKIRRTVITISIISFVLIGIITVFFFVHRYRTDDNRQLIQLAAQVENDLHKLVDSDSVLFNLKTETSTSNGFNSNSFTIDLLPALLSVDINLFDKNGNLTYTSNPSFYQMELISKKINSDAFYQMAIKRQSQFIQTETIGQLEFLSIYLPVRSTKGETLGYLNVPYFNSQMELRQEISNFLVTLINLIAFISIIAGIVAFFITNSITSAFYTIGQKMKAVSLGKTNEPIEWNSDDEIGILVQEYNKMLEQLDESARKLAISEREYAWREMAKQVAHEIKNPLTPMKLNLQYLQRQLENDSPNAKQVAERMASTLVTQIDHLSNIASDFSQLARINVARLEKFDLQDVLQQIVLLYQMDTHICLEWKRSDSRLIMEADRTQINRLFTNLIKNASEAIEDEEACINITEQVEDKSVVVAISDNGPGIPEELKENLFRPNFTTKTSGTGLGLAICKDIAERAGGSIWFESGNGKPTTFYVRLPILESRNTMTLSLTRP